MSHTDELFKKQKYAKRCSLKRVKKSNFISSDFVILLVCYLERVFLHKNPRNICVAICFGFTQKIASLPRHGSIAIKRNAGEYHNQKKCQGEPQLKELPRTIYLYKGVSKSTTKETRKRLSWIFSSRWIFRPLKILARTNSSPKLEF